MNSESRPIFSLVLVLTIVTTSQRLTCGQSTDETTLDFSEGVIVLIDGRVFSGAISNVAGGYRIDWNGTYAIVPFGQVDVTSPTLNEAYLALRDRVLKPTAADHLQLAEWCLKNNLVGQARSETVKALTLEPLRPEAKVLMTQIDKILNPEREQIKLPNQAAMTIDGFLREKDNSAHGVNRETHQSFIRQIQPLLMNKCGNAYCHGQASQSSFRLEHIQRGTSGHRLQNQQNLESVLTLIDQDAPSRSKLLLTDSALSPIHQKVFLGSSGRLQYKILTDWVTNLTGRSVNSDSAGEPFAESILSLKTDRVIQNSKSQSVRLIGGQESIQEESPKELSDQQQRDILKTARHQSRPDPFDPEIFNRRKHGASAKELREQGYSQKKPTHLDRTDLPLGSD